MSRKLIKNVFVFDGKTDNLTDKGNIVIEDNIVKEICSSVCEDYFDEIIDGNGHTAMPGMVESHVHLGCTFGGNSSIDYDVALSVDICKKLLMLGFTSVRDAGGVVFGLKKVFDQNILDGPRIFPSNSAISQTCGHGDIGFNHCEKDIQFRIPTFSVIADGKYEVMRAVREQFFKGASQIKIMAGGGCSSEHDPVQTMQMSYEEMKAAVDMAADYGTYVMAHVYTAPAMMRCGKAGVRCFEHAHLMDEEAAKMISSEGIFVTPMPQFARPLPADSPFVTNKKSKAKGDFVRRGEETATALINKYDIKILFGSDVMLFGPGYQLPEDDDLHYYKRRFGDYKTLLSLTGNANDIIKLTTFQNPYSEGEIGLLKEGAYADILLIDGNPLEDVEVLANPENIKMIMKDAHIYKNTLHTADIKFV